MSQVTNNKGLTMLRSCGTHKKVTTTQKKCWVKNETRLQNCGYVTILRLQPKFGGIRDASENEGGMRDDRNF